MKKYPKELSHNNNNNNNSSKIMNFVVFRNVSKNRLIGVVVVSVGGIFIL